MIKTNGYYFKSMTAVSKYVEIIDFDEDCLMVHIQTIENCKIKIFIRTIAYAKLAMNFFKNGF